MDRVWNQLDWAVRLSWWWAGLRWRVGGYLPWR